MLRIVNKKKFIRGISIITVGLILVIVILVMIVKGIIYLFTRPVEAKNEEFNEVEEVSMSNTENTVAVSTDISTLNIKNEEVLNQWNLKLVNKDNQVDRSYVPELTEIDDGVKIDSRVIKYLKDMINAMYKAGIKSIWVQSAYRSYDKQEQLFNNKVAYYKRQGKDQEEAERLAQTVVQRPEMSEHNLGLAADFNTVTTEFENTEAFSWLKEHAEDYGFVLRYPKDKQDITGITYEPWHWRYVGEEHAKIMNEKGFCLEEYINYLKSSEQI